MKPRPNFTLQGRGSESSNPRALARGAYRLAYTFPPNVLTRVRILDLRDGGEIAHLVRSGSGQAAFTIPADGRYIVAVDPADDSAPWQIAIRPLGLPSQQNTVS